MRLRSTLWIAPAILLLSAAAAVPARAQSGEHDPHAGHEHQGMEGMPGMFGPYDMSREASGTSWQPEAGPIHGTHVMNGPWMTMFHGFINVLWDDQGGPRGDEKLASESMFMVMSRRETSHGALGLRGMISLEPLTTGKSGYPLLFATGETANGKDPLVDRQHPHDFTMELAASYSWTIARKGSFFLYGGLPGEPALGPPTFMHRFSGEEIPEAPITHHWLDSTHITYGVITAGGVWNGWKLEGSWFNGREPDHHRWGIELRGLDSWSGRLSWNPSSNWALQVSTGHLDSPEGLEPEVSVQRTTASVMWHHALRGALWQTTLAAGTNHKDPGETTTGYLLESTLQTAGGHTVFTRIENLENDELFDEGPLSERVFRVTKMSAGYLYEFIEWRDVRFGAGGLVSGYGIPVAIQDAYSAHPVSYMVFVRARL